MKGYLLFLILLCASWGLHAQQLVGVPYVGGTLEPSPQPEDPEAFIEPLVVNLEEVDCTTYVEYVTASRLAGQTEISATDSVFLAKLQSLRYRQGERGNYATRKHYFSEWISDAEKQGLLTDVTAQLNGAEPLHKNIDFMSKHPQFYPPLQKSEALLHEIVKVEEHLSAQKTCFIPKNRIEQAHAQLQDGDIVAFLTTKDGLDIQHVGFVWKPADAAAPQLLHASSSYKCVIVDARTIAEYAQAQKTVLGIRVVRVRK